MSAESSPSTTHASLEHDEQHDHDELEHEHSDPPTPRPKAERKQVKIACTNCREACKKCAEERPCPRCVKYGLDRTCVDAPRKKRSPRPRGPYQMDPTKRTGRKPKGKKVQLTEEQMKEMAKEFLAKSYESTFGIPEPQEEVVKRKVGRPRAKSSSTSESSKPASSDSSSMYPPPPPDTISLYPPPPEDDLEKEEEPEGTDADDALYPPPPPALELLSKASPPPSDRKPSTSPEPSKSNEPLLDDILALPPFDAPTDEIFSAFMRLPTDDESSTASPASIASPKTSPANFTTDLHDDIPSFEFGASSSYDFSFNPFTGTSFDTLDATELGLGSPPSITGSSSRKRSRKYSLSSLLDDEDVLRMGLDGQSFKKSRQDDGTFSSGFYPVFAL